MSYFDDHEDQITGGSRYRKSSAQARQRRGLAEPANPPPVCNRCGKTGLKWRWMDDGWRLFEISREGSEHNRNVPHQCDPTMADDFDVVPATPPAPQPTGTTMLYNRHSDSELERAVYIDPANTAARAEMLSRVPALMGERGGEITEMEKELTHTNLDHAREIEELEYDVADAEKHVSDLTLELSSANARIAALTFAEDLV